jgi:signal transduction histidine kinase
VRARQRDTHFRLTVEDRGRGVDSSFVPHLFDRFARCGPPDEAEGSGLGLSIAQSYAQAHGGELLYSHADPHGARFELVLPRPGHEAERSVASTSPA